SRDARVSYRRREGSPARHSREPTSPHPDRNVCALGGPMENTDAATRRHSFAQESSTRSRAVLPSHGGRRSDLRRTVHARPAAVPGTTPAVEGAVPYVRHRAPRAVTPPQPTGSCDG